MSPPRESRPGGYTETAPTTTSPVDTADCSVAPGQHRHEPLTAAAHGLLARGLHVFSADHPDQPECIGKHSATSPCDGTRGKHPAVKWGVWAVTVTPQMIEREWERHGGLANIAISCGPSGLVVLDEDEPGEIERWCAAYGITLPDTYTVTTGRGQHLYFGWDHTTQRIGNTAKAMDGFKIDVRGDGGFTIGEGSQHASGAIYTGSGQPISELPDQVAELLLAGDNREQPPASPTWEDAVGDHHNTKLGFHDRHKALIAYGGRLRKSGLDYREAEVVFRERWLLCEQPEGQIPEARFHSPACPFPVTLGRGQGQAARRLRSVSGRPRNRGREAHILPAAFSRRSARARLLAVATPHSSRQVGNTRW